MDTYLVTFKRTLAVRHAVEETLAIEVEAHDAEAARLTVKAMLDDDGEPEENWVEGKDTIVGSDVVSTEFLQAVRSENGLPAGTPIGGRRRDAWVNDAGVAQEITEADELELHARFLTFLKVSADVPAALRAIDVDRVMMTVPEAERPAFKAWLVPRTGNDRTREAVETWTDDD